MRSTFKLLFYINRQKIKKNGKCPIMGRITLDGKVCQYSTGEEVLPECWDASKGRAVILGQCPEINRELKEINLKLEEFEEKARLAYKKSVDGIGYVSAELIKNAVTGKAQPKNTLLTLFDEHNMEYEKRVGIDRTRHTYIRYLTTRRHLYDFLQYKYGVEDIALRAINMQFIENFHFYLSTILRLKTISLNDYLILLCKIVRLAVKQKILGRYPFAGYKLEIPPKQHRHLTGEQLSKVMSAELDTYRLCHTRDLFVFSTFTGLGRAEMAELSEKVIELAGIKTAYLEDTEENTTRKLNIDDFVSSAHEFVKNRGGTLDDFLQEVTLYTEGDDEASDSVYLSTVHSAKGMEFRCVFIVGAEEGLFPLSRATEDTDELEEERRLMYVAITRAKEKLYLTYCESRFMYGRTNPCRPSRFFGEMDSRLSGLYAKPKTFRDDYANQNDDQYTESGFTKKQISGHSTGNAAVRQNAGNVTEYTEGTRVRHKKFGEGTVVGVTNVGKNSYLVINFDKFGKITLSLAFAPIEKI